MKNLLIALLKKLDIRTRWDNYGNLYINNGTIDLNGHTLTVYKDVIHAGGTLYINGGKLNIEGDFRIQKILVNEEGKVIYKKAMEFKDDKS